MKKKPMKTPKIKKVMGYATYDDIYKVLDEVMPNVSKADADIYFSHEVEDIGFRLIPVVITYQLPL